MGHEEIMPYISVGIACIIIANIMVYYFFTVISKDYNNKLKIKLLEQQNENTKKSMEDAEVFVSQMQAVRHDVQNQLLTLYGYIESGKNKQAKEYIERLTERHLPHFQKMVATKNDAFDAIVNAKTMICSQNHIFTEIHAEPDSIDIFDPVDTGILFGNLFDNAIEAAQHTGDKMILLNVRMQGDYLSICMENSFNPCHSDTTLHTTKKDGAMHGFGIKNVKKVVEKYDGMIQLFEEDTGLFCCDILLNLPNLTKNRPNLTTK